MTAKNILLIFLGITVLGLIGWLFYTNSKKPVTPVNSTGSGNSLNLNLGGQPMAANIAGVGTSASGEATVNGLTMAEYSAMGFSQSEINAMFSGN